MWAVTTWMHLCLSLVKIDSKLEQICPVAPHLYQVQIYGLWQIQYNLRNVSASVSYTIYIICVRLSSTPTAAANGGV